MKNYLLLLITVLAFSLSANAQTTVTKTTTTTTTETFVKGVKVPVETVFERPYRIPRADYNGFLSLGSSYSFGDTHSWGAIVDYTTNQGLIIGAKVAWTVGIGDYDTYYGFAHSSVGLRLGYYFGDESNVSLIGTFGQTNSDVYGAFDGDYVEEFYGEVEVRFRVLRYLSFGLSGGTNGGGISTYLNL